MMILLILTASSCSKKEDNPSPESIYPRKVSVEYRITSPSGLTMLYSIVRRNATGATELFSNQSLPYSYKFDMNANQLDALLISGTSHTGGTIDCEIFVDGKSVVKKTGSGNTLTDITATYVFE
ncbi:hypothetical protein [Pedobacter aquatilis]|uniref:hypothetical protein n=1 Tax=Pedobacter aquatilis TaxID=351343 RepID=UPI00292E381C|nr:hypothetical protein [Pedobacter aquatilis]